MSGRAARGAALLVVGAALAACSGSSGGAGRWGAGRWGAGRVGGGRASSRLEQRDDGAAVAATVVRPSA